MAVILVDIDGVVADTHTSWLDMYNKEWDDYLQVSDITEWSLHKFVKPECGRKIYNYLERPDFYESVLMIKDALLGVLTLRENKHRVIFVSAGFYPSKIEWLGRNGFLSESFPYKKDFGAATALDVVLCNDKYLIKGDYLIDDRPENVIRFNAGGTGILFTQPWNKKRVVSNRVNNWFDIIEYFK